MVKWDGVRPGVEVIVNGEGPFLFLIDTGAGGAPARADKSLVDRLHLTPVGTFPLDDGTPAAAAAGARMDKYVLHSVRIGSMTFREVEAPSREYNSSRSKRRIDGILGYQLFQGCTVTLDYARSRVSLSSARLRPGPSVIRYGTDDGGPRLGVMFAGHPLQANLDTGDDGGFTLPARAAAALPLSGVPKIVGHGRSANNEFEIREAPLNGDVTLGKVLWRSPSVAFADPFDNVNIGSAALQELSISFDPGRKLVKLKPSPPPSR
jgi:hypothetical protein